MSTQDAQLSLCVAQAFTADAATTNVLDLGVARDIGDGREMSIYIHPTVAADHTSGDETYQFNLETDDNAAFNSTTILQSWVVTYDKLAANKIIELRIPAGLAIEQFIRVLFDGGGTTPTLTADIWIAESGKKPTDLKSYPNGFDG